MASEITGDDVRAWLDARATDDAMTTAAKAVTAYVNGLPAGRGEWPESVLMGALMLAARLYQRRNSASGIEAFADAGTTYISRWDSDIGRLLQIDTFQRPAVG